jgi:hypothetical protein
MSVPLVSEALVAYHQPLVSANTTLDNLPQLENACAPMLVTLFGIFTLSKLLQFQNASFPMLATLSPSVTLFKL